MNTVSLDVKQGSASGFTASRFDPPYYVAYTASFPIEFMYPPFLVEILSISIDSFSDANKVISKGSTLHVVIIFVFHVLSIFENLYLCFEL